MSSYYKRTRNPKTGKFEEAMWIDDLFGQHNYGVIFPSDLSDRRGGKPDLRAIAYDIRDIKLETDNNKYEIMR